jgi:hypothetical protein
MQSRLAKKGITKREEHPSGTIYRSDQFPRARQMSCALPIRCCRDALSHMVLVFSLSGYEDAMCTLKRSTPRKRVV